MLLSFAHIGSTKSRSNPKSHFEILTRLYTDRIQPYYPCQIESFPTESAFLAWLKKQQTRQPATLVLLDSSGRQLSSLQFAAWLGDRRDQGTQHLVFAIGPHDGWSESTLTLARPQPNLQLSLGPITMPHELARLVLAEQLYRACTILQGHPYHGGH